MTISKGGKENMFTLHPCFRARKPFPEIPTSFPLKCQNYIACPDPSII
jgi:hypothetical protein